MCVKQLLGSVVIFTQYVPEDLKHCYKKNRKYLHVIDLLFEYIFPRKLISS